MQESMTESGGREQPVHTRIAVGGCHGFVQVDREIRKSHCRYCMKRTGIPQRVRIETYEQELQDRKLNKVQPVTPPTAAAPIFFSFALGGGGI